MTTGEAGGIVSKETERGSACDSRKKAEALFYGIFTLLSAKLGGYLAEEARWNEYLVLALTMAANLVTEYLYDRFVVFRGSIDTNAAARRRAANGGAK